MSRLIDADDIVLDYSGLVNIPPLDFRGIAEYFAKQIDAMPTVETERKKGWWIPVSKKLPDEDGLYLVTTSKGQVQVHVFNHNGNSEEYWMRCNKAWMPFPEPYQEGKMRMIILSRKVDGKGIYINPAQVCAVFPAYKDGVTIVQFADDENYLEVIESVETVIHMLEGFNEAD